VVLAFDRRTSRTSDMGLSQALKRGSIKGWRAAEIWSGSAHQLSPATQVASAEGQEMDRRKGSLGPRAAAQPGGAPEQGSGKGRQHQTCHPKALPAQPRRREGSEACVASPKAGRPIKPFRQGAEPFKGQQASGGSQEMVRPSSSSASAADWSARAGR